MGFSILEILVVLTVISVLLAFLVPVIRTSKARSQQLRCMNNLRQIGIGMNMHLLERHRYPLGSGTNNYQAELDDRFRCNETLNAYKSSQPQLWGYGYNETVIVDVSPANPPFWPEIDFGGYLCVRDAANIPFPQRKIAMVCCRGGNFWAYPPWNIFQFGPDPWLVYPMGIHAGRDNYLFCDGHVGSYDQGSDRNKINEGWFLKTKHSPWQD